MTALKLKAPQIDDILNKQHAEYSEMMQSALNRVLENQKSTVLHLATELLSHVKEREQQVEEKQRLFQSETAAFQQQVKEHYEQNKDMIDLMSKLRRIESARDSKIKLNIGGKVFHTSAEVLCSVEGSLFTAMFSEGVDVQPDEDGEYFIDRNPKLFPIILDYLRGYDVKPHIKSLSSSFKKQLTEEIEYFKLPEMYDLIQPQKVESEKKEAQVAPVKEVKGVKEPVVVPKKGGMLEIQDIRCAVHVSGIKGATENDVTEFFNVWGKIEQRKMLKRGMAVLVFTKPDEAKNAISNLTNAKFKDGVLTVSEYKPRSRTELSD
jgi:hypothetical protein